MTTSDFQLMALLPATTLDNSFCLGKTAWTCVYLHGLGSRKALLNIE